VAAKFATDLGGEFIVDVGRQLSQDVETSAFPWLMTVT